MSRRKGVPLMPLPRVSERRTYENGFLLGYRLTCPVHGVIDRAYPVQFGRHEWCGRHRPGARRKSRYVDAIPAGWTQTGGKR